MENPLKKEGVFHIPFYNKFKIKHLHSIAWKTFAMVTHSLLLTHSLSPAQYSRFGGVGGGFGGGEDFAVGVAGAGG